MAFNFGQFRKNQLNSYLTDLQYGLIDVDVISTGSQNIHFVDKAILLDSSNYLEPTNASGTAARSYYLRFRIKRRADSRQSITIKLINTNQLSNNEQAIETITVEQDIEEKYQTFDLVISPNAVYNEIYFYLNRIQDDYTIVNQDGTNGRKINVDVQSVSEFYNIINYLNTSIDNKGRLIQIGVQGNPGTLMSINGEGIRIGKSGIYEINNGFAVTALGFAITQNEDKYFILDYQY